MSKGKRYTQQFKEEAVKQIVERGYSVAEVTQAPAQNFIPLASSPAGNSQQIKPSDDQAKIAQLKAELIRVTEECDI